MTMHVQQTLPFPWQGECQCSLQLLIQPWTCAPGTHYGWVDQGSVKDKVCSTLLHMTSAGNQTPDLLILSLMPYPCGYVQRCSLKPNIYSYIQPAMTFLGTGHTLEQTHLARENTGTLHTSNQAAWATWTQVFHLPVHCWVGRGSVEKQVSLTLLYIWKAVQQLHISKCSIYSTTCFNTEIHLVGKIPGLQGNTLHYCPISGSMWHLFLISGLINLPHVAHLQLHISSLMYTVAVFFLSFLAIKKIISQHKKATIHQLTRCYPPLKMSYFQVLTTCTPQVLMIRPKRQPSQYQD